MAIKQTILNSLTWFLAECKKKFVDYQVFAVQEKNLQDQITELKNRDLYPVGSIYLSVTNVNPSEYFGGTWESWGSGRVPVGVSSEAEFNMVEKIGGSKGLQSHVHNYTPSGSISNTTAGGSIGGTIAKGTVSNTTATGAVAGSGNFNTTAGGDHNHRLTYDKDTTKGTAQNRVVPNGDGSTTGGKAGTTNSGAHAHTVPSHTHGFTGNPHSHVFNGQSHTHSFAGAAHGHSFTGKAANTANAGDGNSGNLQPYITCYMWKRVA